MSLTLTLLFCLYLLILRLRFFTGTGMCGLLRITINFALSLFCVEVLGLVRRPVCGWSSRFVEDVLPCITWGQHGRWYQQCYCLPCFYTLQITDCTVCVCVWECSSACVWAHTGMEMYMCIISVSERTGWYALNLIWNLLETTLTSYFSQTDGVWAWSGIK